MVCQCVTRAWCDLPARYSCTGAMQIVKQHMTSEQQQVYTDAAIDTMESIVNFDWTPENRQKFEAVRSLLLLLQPYFLISAWHATEVCYDRDEDCENVRLPV
jgi:hypothetical protein